MKKKIIVQCKVKIGDEYWFPAGNVNGLFKKNLLTNELEFIDFFPKTDKFIFRGYADAQLVDNKIVFAPSHAERIAVYDIKENRFLNISMPVLDNEGNKYLKSVSYNNWIYFIPFMASVFIKYDVYRNQVKVIPYWINIRKEYLNGEQQNLIIREVYVNNNHVFMFMNKRNKAIVLDMNTDQFYIIALNIPQDDNVCSICGHDNNIWLVTDQNNIYEWNWEKNQVQSVATLNNYINHQINYSCITDKYIYFISAYYPEIVLFNYKEKTVEIIDMSKYINSKEDNSCSLYIYYDVCANSNNEIQLYSYYSAKYLSIKENKVSNLYNSFLLPEKYLKKIFSHTYIRENSFIFRNLSISFIDIFNYMMKSDGEKLNNETIGSIIYHTLNE